MMSTIASRRVAISSGFRAMNSTSSATPASRPKMVRYSNHMATVPATTSRLSSQREGSRRRAIQSPVRSASARPATAISQCGWYSTCGAVVATAQASSHGTVACSSGSAGCLRNMLMETA